MRQLGHYMKPRCISCLKIRTVQGNFFAALTSADKQRPSFKWNNPALDRQTAKQAPSKIDAWFCHD